MLKSEYRDWLVKLDDRQLLGQTARVLNQNPELTRFGFQAAAPGADRLYLCTPGALAQVEACLVWLVDHELPPRVGSYRLKHIIERWCGHYISNGAAIVAMLITGHTPVRLIENLNCSFAGGCNG